LFIVFSFPPQVIFLHCNRLVGIWQLGALFFPMGIARKGTDRTLVEEMKKQKNAQGSVGHCLEDSLSGSTPKAEPRPKAATRGSSSELDAKSVFRFLRSAWEVSQRPSRFSAFSSLQLWGSF
jgi:hypothetical protein